jgi:hypothetical protein
MWVLVDDAEHLFCSNGSFRLGAARTGRIGNAKARTLRLISRKSAVVEKRLKRRDAQAL